MIGRIRYTKSLNQYSNIINCDGQNYYIILLFTYRYHTSFSQIIFMNFCKIVKYFSVRYPNLYFRTTVDTMLLGPQCFISKKPIDVSFFVKKSNLMNSSCKCNLSSKNTSISPLHTAKITLESYYIVSVTTHITVNILTLRNVNFH